MSTIQNKKTIFNFYCRTIVHSTPVILNQKNEGQRDTYAVVRNTFQQRAVSLIAVKLRYLQVAGLPLVGLIIQRFNRQLTLHLVEPVSPRIQHLVGIGIYRLMSLRHTLIREWNDSQGTTSSGIFCYIRYRNAE